MRAQMTPLPTLYKHILENLTLSVLMFDADLRLMYINPAGEMLFEVSARRITGMTAVEIWTCGLPERAVNCWRCCDRV